MERIVAHVYVKMAFAVNTNFSRLHFRKFHKQLFRPSTDKRFNLFRRAQPDQATAQTRDTLEDVGAAYDPCQRIQNGAKQCLVRLFSGEVVFNDFIHIDILYLHGLPVLHVVDQQSHFSAARLLSNVSTKQI